MFSKGVLLIEVTKMKKGERMFTFFAPNLP